jgi:predicted PurR-regulated permease PerM
VERSILSWPLLEKLSSIAISGGGSTRGFQVMDMADPSSEDRSFRDDPSRLSRVLTFLASGLVVAILYFARDIIVPITLAILLSFLLSPVVRALRRLRVGRIAAVTMTALVSFLIILGFVAVVVQEVSSLAGDLPQFRSNLEAKVHSLPELVPGAGVFRRAADTLRDLGNELARSETHAQASAGRSSPADNSVETAKPLPVQIKQPDLEPLPLVRSIVGPLLQPLATAGLVAVFVIMILIDWEDLRDRLLRLAGRSDLHRTTEAMHDAAQRVSRYLARQLIVNMTCGVPIGIGLTVIGIPNAALWGIFVVLLRFIPYLGIMIAAAFPLALAIAVDPGWSLLLWTMSLFAAVELIVANLVEPRVYGAGTGLSPIAVILAAVFWTWLWGPIGLLLSAPLTTCLVVLGRHVPHLEFLDVILGNQPVLAPEETFYQRLLASDPEEAAEQAEEAAKERTLAEFFDEVAVPALRSAQADSDRGVLTANRRIEIMEAVRAMLENLSDDEPIENTASAPATMPAVCCIAGRNELDAAAALLLVHLLRLAGQAGKVWVLSADQLMSDASDAILNEAKLICLSLISTSRPARIRYVVRRVRRRALHANLIVGFWGVPQDDLAAVKAAIDASIHAVATLREATALLLALEGSAANSADFPIKALPGVSGESLAAG